MQMNLFGSHDFEAVVSTENSPIPGTRKPDTSPAVSGGEKTTREADRQETVDCPEEQPRNQYGGTTCTKRQPYLPWFVEDDDREKREAQAIAEDIAPHVQASGSDTECVEQVNVELPVVEDVPIDTHELTKGTVSCDLSPITSRGQNNLSTLTKRKVHEIPITASAVPVNLSHSSSSTLPNGMATATSYSAGGYDGGVTVGIEAYADFMQFHQITSTLEAAQKQAQSSHPWKSVDTALGGIDVFVTPQGMNIGGNYWRYIFYALGVMFLIHHDIRNTQQVRVTYRAEALIHNTLPTLHQRVREILSSWGFTITKETITRVDMQVMLDVPLSDFTSLIFNEHVVTDARSSAAFMESNTDQTYWAGDIKNIQIALYDKRAQMKSMKLEKRQLVISHSIGLDWWNSDRPITRVELRLARAALRNFGIDSVDDLLKRERAIIDWVTHDWFRLLKRPKVKGMGKRAKIHPLWERVRALFYQYFPGDAIRDLTRRSPNPILLDSTPLLQQAAGCLAKAICLDEGQPESPEKVHAYISAFGATYKDQIFCKAKQIAAEQSATMGITLNNSTTAPSPDNTSESSSSPHSLQIASTGDISDLGGVATHTPSDSQDAPTSENQGVSVDADEVTTVSSSEVVSQAYPVREFLKDRPLVRRERTLEELQKLYPDADEW